MSYLYLILCLLSLVLFFYALRSGYKKIFFKEDKVTLELLKAAKKYFILGLLSAPSVFLFATLAFYFDKNNQAYFLENSLFLDGLHGFYQYFGAFILGVSIFLFSTILISYLYIYKDGDKAKKILRWTIIGSLIPLIGFALMYLEGLAPFLKYPLANQILFSQYGVTMVYSVGKYETEGFHFSIALYALTMIGGALLVLAVCDYFTYKKYGEHGLLTTMFFIAFPAGVIGSRIWYVIAQRDVEFANNPRNAFAIWNGGLAIMGGAIGGAIAGIAFMIYKMYKDPKYRKVSLFYLMDVIIPAILIAQGIGRWGNFFNTEVHGNAVDQTSWMWLPTFIRNNMRFSSTDVTLTQGQIYVPLFLIESMVNFFGYFFIEYGLVRVFGLSKKFGRDIIPYGSGAGWYLVWYGATRAIMEPMRDSSYQMGNDHSWSVVSSYYLIGFGLLIVIAFIVLKILSEKKILVFQWDKIKQIEEKKND
jgi:phosphatidylglycerol:prolipoprotein diacylglycerol transferase